MRLLRVGPTNSMHTNVRAYSLQYMTNKNLKNQVFEESAEASERYKELLQEINQLEAEIQNLRGTSDRSVALCTYRALNIEYLSFVSFLFKPITKIIHN